MDLYETFVAPFEAPFMQRALLAVLLLSVPAGLLGAWIVTRRLAFLTHATGQSTFPALVIATLAGWSLTGSAVAASVLIGLVLAGLERRTTFARGVAVAVVMSSALALGAVLVSDIEDPGVSANGLLFGSVLALTGADLVVAAALAVLTLVAGAIIHRPLAAATFHREIALASGRRAVTVADVVLIVLLAIASALAVRVVGSLLVAGLFLIPSATARLTTRRLVPLMVAGGVGAAATAIGGLWLAWQLDAPPGATIAALAASLFLVVALGVTVRRRVKMRMIPSCN